MCSVSFEFCQCRCQQTEEMKHRIACCNPCRFCGRRISAGWLGYHEKKCSTGEGTQNLPRKGRAWKSMDQKPRNGFPNGGLERSKIFTHRLTWLFLKIDCRAL